MNHKKTSPNLYRPTQRGQPQRSRFPVLGRGNGRRNSEQKTVAPTRWGEPGNTRFASDGWEGEANNWRGGGGRGGKRGDWRGDDRGGKRGRSYFPEVGMRGIGGGRKGRQNSTKHEHIQLNKQIASCTSAEAVFEALQQGRGRGVVPNAVNVSTAIHRLGRAGARGHERDSRFQTLLAEAEHMAADFKPQNVANTLWAFATMRVEMPKPLVECMVLQAERVAADFNPQDVANTLWAFATMGVQMPKPLVECMARQAERMAADFNPQEVVNTLWAAAASDHVASLFSVFAQIAAMAKQSRVWPDFSLPEVHQMHQFFLAAEQDCPDKECLSLLASPDVQVLAMRCREAFVAYSRAKTNPSRLQARVASSFRRVLEEDRRGQGVEVAEEQVLEVDGGGYSVDMVLRGLEEGRRVVGVVVEVDGPSHFVAVAGGEEGAWRENGSTSLKRRLLVGLGWEVISVPFFEWNLLRGSNAKDRYVRELLHFFF